MTLDGAEMPFWHESLATKLLTLSLKTHRLAKVSEHMSDLSHSLISLRKVLPPMNHHDSNSLHARIIKSKDTSLVLQGKKKGLLYMITVQKTITALFM